MSISSSVTGGPVGSKYGKAFRGHGERKADKALAGGTLDSSYAQIMSLLQSYQGGPSQLSLGLSGYEKSLADADPVFAAYKKTIMEGMNFDQNGLPADFARQLTETTRGAQSARGVLDSDTSAIQEAVALMGGREMIRSRRLNEVQDYLGGVVGGGLAALMPTIKDLYGGELQRAVERSKRYSEANQTGGGVYGSSSGSLSYSEGV